jgi:hypothetical protein
MWVALLCAAVLLVSTATASAQQAVSPAYGVDEVFFGTGGTGDDNCVGAYCAKTSTGEFTTGYTDDSGTNQIRAGNNTSREEFLEFTVNGSNTDLGVLSAGSAATTTGTFKIRDYLSSGYVVLNASDPPRLGPSGHILANLASPTASSPGTEQFGINLKLNSSPTAVGAEAVQVPDSTFSFGAAASGYNTVNQYKYVKGNTIAASTRSSGETDYTVTYLYNISTVTPAGIYTFNHDMVAVATY